MFGGKDAQPLERLIIHTAGDGPDGFTAIDVWESREALTTSSTAVMPAIEEAGMSMEGAMMPTIIELPKVLVNEEARA
jgi:hypothetical protein